MRNRLLFTLTLLALCLPAHAQTPPADVVFRNGNIYTVNPKQPKAQAVAVRRGRIVWIGPNAGAARYKGQKTQVVDLRGATVVPGLTDAHCHLSGIGEREMAFDLTGVPSLARLQSRLKARLKGVPPGRWVSGRGWIETHWKPSRFPTRTDLDAAAPDNPVLLVRADGHGGVANSRALAIAGIKRDTPNPAGGEIVRDPTTGEATGMLLDSALDRLEVLLPARTEADLQKQLRLGAARSLRMGWCQVQIAGVPWSELQTLRRLSDSGALKLRIYATASASSAPTMLANGPIIGANGGFTARGIKLYADGALGSKGAALLAPYEGETSSGFLTTSEGQVMPLLTEALRRGVQVQTHAIGDRANRVVLDWYEKAFASVPPVARRVKEPRFRIEHAQLVHPDDVGRFARLGVIPSMQPSHAIGDLHFAPSRIGQARLDEGYSWQRFLSAGSPVAGGSDAPVEEGNPLVEFYAAVTRRDLKGYQGKGWHPEQAVSRMDALKMFTLWAAHAAFQERDRGTLEVGKLADLTVLSSDIMTVPAAQIPKARCLMTVIGGQIVYKVAAP